MNKADNLQISAEEAAKEYVSDINCHLYNESINDTIKAFSRDAFEQGAKWYEENVLSHHINVLAERIKQKGYYKTALGQTLWEIVEPSEIDKVAKDYINELNLNK